MSNEFQDLSTTPTLTLDPFQAEEEKKMPAEAERQEPALDENILTEEEQRNRSRRRTGSDSLSLTRKHQLSAPPRPTRPRSWCS